MNQLQAFHKFLEEISKSDNTHSRRARRRKMERAINKYNIKSDEVPTNGKSEE